MLSIAPVVLGLLLPPPSLTRRAALQAVAATSAAALVQPGTAASSKAIPVWTLPDGVLMPTLSLNTAGLSASGSERAYLEALALGINHVDFHPGIERDGVAAALKAASPARSSIFLTTKISKPAAGTSPQVAAAAVRSQLDEDLGLLGVSYVDMLMLRDSPDCEVMRAQWAAMEAVKEVGKARAIGVVNYCERSLGCILASATQPPAVNYYMEHIGMGSDPLGLRSYGESRGVRSFAYGALGEPGPSSELLASPAVRSIAEAHRRSPEQVALRWVVQSGFAVSVRPTDDFGLGRSACEDEACAKGLRARRATFDWALSPKEMATLSSLSEPSGNPTLFSSTGCPDSFFASK